MKAEYCPYCGVLIAPTSNHVQNCEVRKAEEREREIEAVVYRILHREGLLEEVEEQK